MPAGPQAHLVVGLGNPDPEFERTRHNVGFRVVDVLSERLGVRLRRRRERALVGEARDGEARIVLAKPLTYMNLSGEAVGALARFFKVPPERIIAVHDDIDLAFGSLRVKIGGGTAGHHGLDSMAQALRTKDFVRVRLGVGRPPGRQDPADYVLEPFAKRQEPEVAVMVADAADAVLAIVHEGLDVAQNRFNPRRG